MAVSVVAGDAVFQPENICDAEIVLENFGVVFAGEAGIAFLRFAEKAFFRGEQRAAAVHIDAAAFQNDAPPFVHQVARRGA